MKFVITDSQGVVIRRSKLICESRPVVSFLSRCGFGFTAGIDAAQCDAQADNGGETVHRKWNRRVAQPTEVIDKHAHCQLTKDHSNRSDRSTDTLYRQHHNHDVRDAKHCTKQLPFRHIHQGKIVISVSLNASDGGRESSASGSLPSSARRGSKRYSGQNPLAVNWRI